jgi:hypothetical protein
MRYKRFSNGFYNKITLILLLGLSSLFPGPSAGTPADSSVAILRFNSYSVTATTVAALDFFLQEAARKNRLFKIPPTGLTSLWYEYDTRSKISPSNLSRYEALCEQLKCRYLFLGMVYQQKNIMLIQAKIYSSPEKIFICTLEQSIEGNDLKNAAAMLVRKATLFFNQKLPAVSGLTISKGTSKDSVTLTWTSNTTRNTYMIFRSPYSSGPYEAIGETSAGRFSDTTAEVGIKYWYRVTVTQEGLSGLAASGFGYRNPPSPKGLTYNELMEGHTRPWPTPASEAERVNEKKNLKLFEKYYESYFLVNFIIMVGRIYINSGELLAFRGFKLHSIDMPNRTVYFSKPGIPLVRFRSNRFFRFYFRDAILSGLDSDAILKRVVDNAVFFCIYSGVKEMKEPDGRTRLVPILEVVGLMSEYHHNYEKWKSNVVIFATSDEELYRRIREAQTKGY